MTNNGLFGQLDDTSPMVPAENEFAPARITSARAIHTHPRDSAGNAAENATDTVLSSAARTASINSADQTNLNYRGVQVIIDATAASATPSLTVKIQGKDPVSGKYYDLITSAAITGISTTVLKVYPGITASANAAVSDVLPKTWRVSVTAANTDSITYSAVANLIL